MKSDSIRKSYDLPGTIWTLIRTDFLVRYHGTIMGFFWALLKPIIMFLVLISVFSFIFRKPQYGINLFLGLVLYEYFREGTQSGLTSLYTKGYLINKSIFPRWILVLTSLANAFLTILISSAATIVYLAIFCTAPSLKAVLFHVMYLLEFLLIIAGFSLGTSVLFLRHRDLNQIWEVLAYAGFFLAPIIYPIELLPERFQAGLYVWPPTAVIQFSRAALIHNELPTLGFQCAFLGISLFFLFVGVFLYRRFVAGVGEYL